MNVNAGAMTTRPILALQDIRKAFGGRHRRLAEDPQYRRPRHQPQSRSGFKLSDRICVLRRGKQGYETKKTDKNEIITMISGLQQS